jgi:nucleoside-diphosphate-sugar epimerase
MCLDLRHINLHSLPDVHTVVISLSPDSSSLSDYQSLYQHLIPSILKQLNYQRAIMISSTRVYCRHQPNLWADENSTTTTLDLHAAAILAAERAVIAHSFKSFAIIRPSGLYETSAPPPASWLSQTHWANRVHYHDLARFLSFIINSHNIPAQLTVNLSDEHPFIPQKIAPFFKTLRPETLPIRLRNPSSIKISNLLSKSLGFEYQYPSALTAYIKNTNFIKNI